MLGVDSEAVRGRYRDAFAVPEFRSIFASHLISMLGAVAAELALTILVFDQTGSPLLSALVLALSFMPYLLAGTLLTSLVDRAPTRKLMIISNLLSAVIALLMVLPHLAVWALLSMAFLLGLIAPVFAGTRAATLPDVLSETAYPPGRSLLRIVAHGALISGFALGGLLLAIMTPREALIVTACSFVISAVVLRLGTKERPPTTAVRPPLLQDSLIGFGQVMRESELRRILLLGWAVPAIAGSAQGLIVPYADILKTGGTATGLLMAAMPTGYLLGELIVTWRVSPEVQRRMITAMAAFVFIPLLAYALRPGVVETFAVLAISGTGYAYHIGLDRLLIDVAPQELRGRALSIQSAGLMFFQGVGLAVAGAIAEFVSPHKVVASSAVAGLAVVALMGKSRKSTAKP